MPSTYAHYRFGTGLLPTLPADIRRTVQRFRGLYDVGLHGPDIFFYQLSPFRAKTRFLGIKYHEQTGKEFFQRVCRAVRLEKSEAARAYLYGLLSHYCLDSVCHPFVKEKAGEGTASHLRIEAEFERFLLESDGKTPPCAQDLSPHIKLTPGECDTVSKFYPAASAATIRDCVTGMARFTRLVAVPEGAKRTALEKGMAAFAGNLADVLLPLAPDPVCSRWNAELLSRYTAAEAVFPEMLSQLQAHLTYSGPFGEEFAPIFG